MIITAAQTIAVKGNIEANIAAHVKLINRAAEMGPDLIFFPELSLTGYEPELSKALAISVDDDRLSIFKELSVLHTLIIGVGIPLKDPSGVLIAMILFMPDGSSKVYNKQYLHPGEEEYFVAKSSNLQLSVKGKLINFAICADYSNPAHAQQASEMNGDIYLVSALISKAGFDYDSGLLRGYAEKYNMRVILSNYGGVTGGYNCAGRSSSWSVTGVLEDFIMGDQEALLSVEL